MAEKIEIAVEVKGADKAKTELKNVEKAGRAVTDSTKENTKATKENTDAITENTAAKKANSESSEKTGGVLDNLRGKFRAHMMSVEASKLMNESFAALMAGKFTTAMRLAAASVVEFTMAILANPIGAVVAAVLALAGAVAGVATGWRDAKQEMDEYIKAASTKIPELDKRAEASRHGGDRFGGMNDEQLERMRQDAQKRDEEAQRTRDEAQAQAHRWGDSVGRHGVLANSAVGGRRTHRAQRWLGRWEEAQGAQDKTAANLAEIEKEQERRRKAREDAYMESIRQSNAQLEEAARIAMDAATERRKREVERDKRRAAIDEKLANLADEQKYADIEKESGTLAGLNARRGDVVSRMESLGGSLDDEEKRVALKQELFRLDQRIAAEEELQAKAAERAAEAEMRSYDRRASAQEEWERSRKLREMDSAKRLAELEKEVKFYQNVVSHGGANAENEARLRRAIDERDAAKKEVERSKESTADKTADLWNKRQDFLHRNDTDAQKLRDTSKYLQEAKASGDTSAMLELMMSGEELAGNYEEPLTKKQQRSAARKAKRDERAAKWAARAFRRQARAIEADWKENQGSAEEAAKKLTKEAGGTASFMVKNGRLVKVEGTDRTNQLLDQILAVLK